MSETWISVAEAAEITGRSHETVRRIARSGAVGTKRVGARGWLSVRADDVEALIVKSYKGADAAGVAAGTEDRVVTKSA
jgi:hypothetical protein